jgi:hypothetical protein
MVRAGTVLHECYPRQAEGVRARGKVHHDEAALRSKPALLPLHGGCGPNARCAQAGQRGGANLLAVEHRSLRRLRSSAGTARIDVSCRLLAVR